MPEISFGFEAEFSERAPELVRALRSSSPGMIAYDELHSYHCDCGDCEDFTLKAQRDSSCSGEIISGIFYDIDEARPAFEAIQDAAFAADAEPGWSAGFHVHVGRSTNFDHLAVAFFEFMRWESTLSGFSAGRFGENRGNNNVVVHNLHRYLMGMSGHGLPWVPEPREIYDPSRDRYVVNPDFREATMRFTIGSAIEWLHENPQQNVFETLLMNAEGMDRHANLAVRTRHNTWEFRLFNSTRTAWRMELWCQIARAFMVPEFISALQAIDVPTMEELPAVLSVYDDTAAELAARQVHYRANTDFDDLPEFTAA